MNLIKSSKKREGLYQIALSKLRTHSKENINIIIKHLFHLKVNEDFVINSSKEVEELVEYINDNE
ncbi:hypothetical protein [Ancylomarina longa]|uniref:hypothetical protein n=1 Tax=Ancylomarina longa TaxID=2487017 RepID=UPI001ADE9DFA|nr:hypothetical protein [Ancylomarina longa]